MVQEDTCSTSEAIDCERNESVTIRLVLPEAKISAARRAFQRAVGEKGTAHSLCWPFVGRNSLRGRTVGFVFPRARHFHKLYALNIALDIRSATKSQIRRSRVRPLPLRVTAA